MLVECENPRVRRVDLPEARKKEGNEKRREILFLLEVWRYGRMVRWKGDEKKEKSPVDVRVDGLKRYELEARRSSHSLRLPGWIKLQEGRKEREGGRGERERERAHRAFRCLHRHISTTLPSGLSSRYQSLRIRLQICPPLQQISAERLFPSGWDTVSIEDESSPGTGFSIVAGHLGFFTQPSNGRMSVSGSLLYAYLYRESSCPRFSQVRRSITLKKKILLRICTNIVGCTQCEMCAT